MADEIKECIDFSVVIPTWNRSKLVAEMLRTLYDDRKEYSYGRTEVIIVDSSVGEERTLIEKACKDYDARYIEGVDSVRKKRNLGIDSAVFDYIFFIDSDVLIETGMLNAHAKIYLSSKKENLGGVCGLTKFYGEKTFLWKVLDYTNYLYAFGQAEKYPYSGWTIGNNVSFKKSILLDIGKFEENLPFKLGGDDLDLSYRVVKSGHPIKNTPAAITHHARETWDSKKAIGDRTKRWGTMEYYNAKRHPELMRHTLMSVGMFVFLALIASIVVSAVFRIALPIVGWLGFAVASYIAVFFVNASKIGKFNLFYYSFAKIIFVKYWLYRVKACVKHGAFGLLFKVAIFNEGHAKAEFRERLIKLSLAVVMLLIVAAGVFLLQHFGVVSF